LKLKFTILSFVILSVISCASLQTQKQESAYFDAFDFELVWDAAANAVRDMGFVIKNMEKGSGFIYAEGGRNILTQNEPPQLNVSVIEENGRIRVDCQSVQPGQLLDYGASQKNARKFFEALNKNLNK